jgi:hypothetical protein
VAWWVVGGRVGSIVIAIITGSEYVSSSITAQRWGRV